MTREGSCQRTEDYAGRQHVCELVRLEVGARRRLLSLPEDGGLRRAAAREDVCELVRLEVGARRRLLSLPEDGGLRRRQHVKTSAVCELVRLEVGPVAFISCQRTRTTPAAARRRQLYKYPMTSARCVNWSGWRSVPSSFTIIARGRRTTPGGST
ncbi:hypothetical protein J6590_057768 [Homalodisca vitripennis]|nr:hypothetical protein J6590_057768 [Homalodisca vitripennis]